MGKRRHWRDAGHGDKRTREDGKPATNENASSNLNEEGVSAAAQREEQAGELPGNRSGYTNTVVQRSDAFDDYYRAQLLVAPEDFDKFADTLLAPLPITFRINPMSPLAGAVRKSLSSEFSVPFVLEDGSVIPPPQPLPWYPGGDAYQFSIPRHGLRKSGVFKTFHQWLIALTDAGAISRQEAVSMVPPLLLDVRPTHFVLDMCASPGSKTAQMLEAMHSGEPVGELPTGMVVANDKDSSRAYMLVHQCQRINSRALLVTCHDAEKFPSFIRAENRMGRVDGCFDRVLCDVPCTGDGTARKNADVFKKWSPAPGIGLHPLQLQIAMRGLSLLAVGGLMVYSTCSFNPIENEAVVAEVLRRSDGAVELVDVSAQLPGLHRSPGLLTWRVFDGGCVEHADYTASQKRDASGRYRKPQSRLSPSMFPPSATAAPLNLERCLRLLPHLQDTGGFFVALLRKTRPLPHGAATLRCRPGQQPAGSTTQGDEDTVAATSGDSTAVANVIKPADTHDVCQSTSTQLGVDEPFGSEAEVVHAAPLHAGVSISIAADAAVAGLDVASRSDSTVHPLGTLSDTPPFRAVAQGTTAQVAPPVHAPGVAGVTQSAVAIAGDDTYKPPHSVATETLRLQFGLHPSFPFNLLFTRSDKSRAIVVAQEAVAELALSVARPTGWSAHAYSQALQAAAAVSSIGRDRYEARSAGGSSLKVVFTGVKVFEANTMTQSQVQRAHVADVVTPSSNAHDATVTAEHNPQPRAFTAGGVLPAGTVGYRLLQDGVTLLLPFLSRQVVYASVQEMIAVVRILREAIAEPKTASVDASRYPPRLRAALLNPGIAHGSLVLVVHPGIEGPLHDGNPAALHPPTPSAGNGYAVPDVLLRAFDVSEGGAVLSPKPSVPLSHASAIPPALRVHYVEDASSSSFHFKPQLRAWAGADPLAFAAVCMWKGKNRISAMLSATEAEALQALLEGRSPASETDHAGNTATLPFVSAAH